MSEVNLEGQQTSVNDLFSIKGKVAVITGGSRGIGLMIAKNFVEAGARVYISSRKKEVCDQVAAELSKIGECISLPADISSEEGIKQLAEKVSSREKSLNILINNAGANWAAPLAEYPYSGFNKVISLNVVSPFFCTREFAPLLKKAAKPHDPARVINIGSIEGIMIPAHENYAYSASKAAIHHMTKVLCSQLGSSNITVNAIAPGFFKSKMTQWLYDNERKEIEDMCPLNRLGTSEDMAGVSIFLASRAGAYVNGAVIPVDGGTCL